MVIVRIYGGLGNQLFQYALYRSLEEKGKEAYLDTRILKSEDYRDVRNITLFPSIKIKEADSKLCIHVADSSRVIYSRLRRKIFGRKKTYVEEDYNLHFQAEIFNMDYVYLAGCWQSELYFKQIREALLEELNFPKMIGTKNRELLTRITNCNSVSLHIRRGDYLTGRAKQLYGGICTHEYYRNAMEYMQKKYDNVHFYIFTNDVGWALEKYQGTNVTVVDWNQGAEDYLDMHLMSKCRHNIIANSSFSWWGAWLNQNRDKEVVCPSKWFNPAFHDAPHIICKEWTKMEG